MHVVSKFKQQIFFLEALNALATGFYFNWVFFYTQKILHFGVLQNLGLVAVHGSIYTGAAWLGGWFGHRYGNFAALRVGFCIMGSILTVGSFLNTGAGQVCAIILWTFGMCFTWPMLQSIISANEPQKALPTLAGLYNLTWSLVAAISFFAGGTIVEQCGMKSVFLLPAAIHAIQFIWIVRLQNLQPTRVEEIVRCDNTNSDTTLKDDSRQRLFLRLALLANPIAYVAINTLIPMMPEVAKRFQLTPKWIGIVGAIWFFVRSASFVFFWLWPKWHYRFRWLMVASVALACSFAAILMSYHLFVVIAAQVVFGISAGLIYYSSLFYSLDGGNAKSEHGGAHEAMIGLGTFVGACVGVAAKYFWPTVTGVSIWAVTGVLLFGCVALGWVRNRAAHAS